MKRLIELIGGTCCISFGIAFMAKANIGMSPISSCPYVISTMTSKLSLGNLVLIWNAIFAILQIPVEGKKYKVYLLLQIPLAFLLGYVTDLAKWLIEGLVVELYPLQLGVCLLGIMITALGVFMTVKADLIMNGPEAFLHSLANRFGKSFGSLKIAFDVSNVVLAVALALIVYHYPIGIREGTILSAILTGVFVNVYQKLWKLIYKE